MIKLIDLTIFFAADFNKMIGFLFSLIVKLTVIEKIFQFGDLIFTITILN